MDREHNLAKFLAGNHPEVPRVMYHGTDRGMTGIFEGARGVAAHLAFDPETATKYAEQHDVPKINYTYFNKLGPQIYPVHVSAKNVFDARKEKHVRMIGGHPSQNWDWQDLEKSIPAIKKAGFDSYFDFEHGIQGFKSGAEPTGLAVFDPHQIKSATGNQGTFDPSNPDITKGDGGEVDGITAYHGSPHEFEQFDTSKIGTGEGAQAYGHGLYFAESEPVAKQYRERLGKTTETSGETMADEYVIQPHFYKNMTDEEIAEHMQEPAKWAEQKIFDQGKMKYVFEDGSMLIHDDNEIKAVNKDPGHMYEVHIDAHPDHFLDWDKPAKDQHPHILNAIAPLFPDGIPETKRYGETFRGGDLYDLMKQRLGGLMYKKLADEAGIPSRLPGGTDERLSKYLISQGIHGIKYFDQGSRDRGGGTRNYVVFDHDRVNIKRRYAEGGEVEREGFGFGGDTVGAGSRPERGATGSASAARAAREAPAQQAAPAESHQDTRGYRDMPPDLLQAQLDLNARGRAATEAMQRANETRMPFGYVGRGAPSAYDIANQEHMPAWAIGPAPATSTFGDNSIVAGGVFTGGAKQQTPVTHYESTPMQNQIDYATPPLPVPRPAPMPAPRPASVTAAPPMPTPRPADLQPSFIENLGSAMQDILSVPSKIVSGIGNAFTQQPQQQQPQPQGGNRGRRLVKKLMPDGTYQDVWEEYAHGGVAKYHSNHHNPAIVEYALNKISAPPPALDPTLMVAKRGRPF